MGTIGPSASPNVRGVMCCSYVVLVAYVTHSIVPFSAMADSFEAMDSMDAMKVLELASVCWIYLSCCFHVSLLCLGFQWVVVRCVQVIPVIGKLGSSGFRVEGRMWMVDLLHLRLVELFARACLSLFLKAYRPIHHTHPVGCVKP